MWVEALRSGHYKKICGAMREEKSPITGEDYEVLDKFGTLPDMSPKNNNMCVMGVLADLALKDSGLKPTVKNWIKFASCDEQPSERTIEWAGLETADRDGRIQNMIEDNDSKAKTFRDFADYIERNF